LELERKGKADLLALVQAVLPSDMVCSYVRQPRALGLGHAVLCAQPIVGNEPFAVLLADDLMMGEPGGAGVTAQLVDAFLAKQSSVLAVQDVARADTDKYGIVDSNGELGALVRVAGIVEKPKPADAPSTLGVAGRYVLSPAIFEHLAQIGQGAGGEIQLTDAIARLVGTPQGVHALRYNGKRYDCGSKLGFLQATFELAQRHPEVGAAFKEYLAGQGG
jgi:UTP--glucose-1-phosphate uridylyltransferase